MVVTSEDLEFYNAYRKLVTYTVHFILLICEVLEGRLC